MCFVPIVCCTLLAASSATQLLFPTHTHALLLFWRHIIRHGTLVLSITCETYSAVVLCVPRMDPLSWNKSRIIHYCSWDLRSL